MTISLDEFRHQYVGRVLAMMEHDFEKAAAALGMHNQELKALVGVTEN